MYKQSLARCLKFVLLTAIASLPCAWAQAPDPTPVIHVDNPLNTPAQQAKHYVILVSLDGFRYDYPAKYGAPHIQAMGDAGASAPEGMRPSYPSLTFPNHLSIVTGLYPEHHGIVANSFFDPTRTPEQGQRYSYTDPKTNGDGSWYGGTPLWVLAEQQGMRSACLFWPGSEAEIQGKRPSYYLRYDDKLDDAKRVDQVIAWLSLPPELRPHFITLYYSNVDHAGHAYGPESEEVRAAVHHVDDMIGDLQTKVAALKLPVDLVVLADHGMVTLNDSIDLSQFADLSDVHTEGSLLYAKDDAAAEKLYEQFKAHPDPRFNAYRRKDVSSSLHYEANPREGDPIIVPNGPYTFRTKPLPEGGATGGALHGGHGFDPKKIPEMKAIFFVEGPDIKPCSVISTFENIDVYPFIAEVLQLVPKRFDGDAGPLSVALTDQSLTTFAGVLKSWPKQVGEGVSAPEVITQVSPKFTKEGRKAKVNGSVLVGLVVEEDGVPSHVHVIKSFGYGLDEQAVIAVSKYRFKPSMENGIPVRVEVNVDVHFQIFERELDAHPLP